MAMTMPPPDAAATPRRTDARRNRQLLLEASARVLAEKGVDAQMSDIAEAAGLSVGTLYRNFPSKEVLVNALVLERLRRSTHRIERAAEQPDAWQALVDLLTSYADRQLENRMESQFLGGRINGSPEIHAQREHAHRHIEKLVKRAQHEGALRKDVTGTEIQMILLAIGHLASSDSPHARRLVQRHVTIVMDGLRAPGTTRLPGRRWSRTETLEVLHQPMGRDPSTVDLNKRGRRSWTS